MGREVEQVKSKKPFLLVNEEGSQNLRWETVMLRQQTTRHFPKTGILFPNPANEVLLMYVTEESTSQSTRCGCKGREAAPGILPAMPSINKVH